MKALRWIFKGLFLVLILGAMFGLVVTPILQIVLDYNTNMSGLDSSSANGNLVTAYNTNEDVYFDTYLPKELKAKKPKQVGYILNVTYGTVSQKYYGDGYFTFTKDGETVDAQLIDCSTGEVIARQYFEAYFPERIEMADELKVEPSVISEWLIHVYPEWPADKDVGHDYGPDGCSVCGQLPNVPAETEPTPTESPAVPETTVAATEAPKSTDVNTPIIGQWNLDFIMGGETFAMVPFDGNIKFQINEDFTASITTPDNQYSYDWVYNFEYYEDDDPNKYVYCYLLFDEAGNEIYFYYYYDGTVSIITDEYSVFFVRG